jgi:Xaa-Pro dipeptidase
MAARRVIEEGGFGPDYRYFTHRVGHGIGMDGHEWTYLVRGNTTRQPGMCFSDEPGIYIPGELGVRHEDVIYITPEGLRTRRSGRERRRSRQSCELLYFTVHSVA